MILRWLSMGSVLLASYGATFWLGSARAWAQAELKWKDMALRAEQNQHQVSERIERQHDAQDGKHPNRVSRAHYLS
jgi:hypothetical protein